MLARIENGQVAEQKDMSINDVPEHKRANFLPIEGEKPAYDRRTHTISGPTFSVEANRVLRTWTVTPRDLTLVKSQLKAAIDDYAENIRLSHITPGDGMQMTYREKFEQAVAVDKLGETDANALTEAQYTDAFPVLAASVGIEGATLWDCAQLVLARYTGFNLIANAIEKARLSGKKAVSDATNVDAALAAYEAVTWPT